MWEGKKASWLPSTHDRGGVCALPTPLSYLCPRPVPCARKKSMLRHGLGLEEQSPRLPRPALPTICLERVWTSAFNMMRKSNDESFVTRNRTEWATQRMAEDVCSRFLDISNRDKTHWSSHMLAGKDNL